MRAALALLGQAPVGARGRRIAVLGDMLELGPQGPQFHAALADAVVDNGVDLVFCAGPLMRSLWEALPSERRGGYARSIRGARKPLCWRAVRAGDAVLVKGSLGSKMGPIVKALTRQYSGSALRRRQKVDPMLYWLADLSSSTLVLQPLPLPDLPHRRRDGDGAGHRVPVRPAAHRHAARAAGQGPADPRRRAASAPRQARHADHGRADDPDRACRSRCCCGRTRATRTSGSCSP